MKLKGIQHYNIRTPKFDETIHFYVNVLQMKRGAPPTAPGAPPPVNKQTAWILDAENNPIIHMAGVDPSNKEAIAQQNAYLGERSIESLVGSGAIDHIAMEASDYDQFVSRCKEHKCEFLERETAFGLKQLFVFDPNGIKLELNFLGESKLKVG